MFLMSFTWFPSSQFCPSLFLPLPHVFNLCSPFSLSWLLLCAPSASLVRHQRLHFFSLLLRFVWFNWKGPSVFGPTPTQEVTNTATNGFVLISVWSSACPGGVWYSKDPTKKKVLKQWKHKWREKESSYWVYIALTSENYNDIFRWIDPSFCTCLSVTWNIIFSENSRSMLPWWFGPGKRWTSVVAVKTHQSSSWVEPLSSLKGSLNEPNLLSFIPGEAKTSTLSCFV